MAQYRRNKETGVVEQLFKLEDGSETWYKTKLDYTPDEKIPGPGQYGLGGSRVYNPAVSKQNVQERYRQNLEALNEQAAFERDAEAQEMGTWEKGMILAGRETDKLLSGAAEIKDMVRLAAGSDEALDDIIAREQEQKEKDELSAQLEANSGMGGLFKMLPYLATGYGIGPIAQKTAAGTVRAATEAAANTAVKGKGLLTTGVDALANTGGRTGQLGQKMQREWTHPLAQNAARKSQQINYVNPYREGALSRVLGDAGLGMGESTLHYDQDPIDGLIASAAGRLGGELAGPALRRSPDFYDPADRSIVDWGKSKGMRFLPGQDTGNRGQQMFEAGLRSDAEWTDTIKGFDRTNEAINNRVAYESMGIPTDRGVARLTPSDLGEHMNGLKQQYQALEAGTVGRLDAPVMRNLDLHMKRLSEAKGPGAIKIAKSAAAALEEIKRLSTREVKRGPRGRFVKRTFNGEQYQTIRRDLKDAMDKAYASGDSAKARALKPFLKELDAGMEKGIKDFGGDASAGQWKDLNERYAMTKLVIEHGSTPTGKVDLGRLTNHFQTSDPERLLLESGGRVTDLHRLAKLDYLLKSHAGSALSGTGMTNFKNNSSKQSATQRLLGSPAGNMVPIVPDSLMRLYARGYPSKTGLLNMGSSASPSIGGRFWEHPGLYTRALAQSSQIHPEVLRGGANAVSSIWDYANESMEDIGNLFSMADEEAE
jgi:hypothetical protein